MPSSISVNISRDSAHILLYVFAMADSGPHLLVPTLASKFLRRTANSESEFASADASTSLLEYLMTFKTYSKQVTGMGIVMSWRSVAGIISNCRIPSITQLMLKYALLVRSTGGKMCIILLPEINQVVVSSSSALTPKLSSVRGV